MRITEEQLAEIAGLYTGSGYGMFYDNGWRDAVTLVRAAATPDDPPFQPGDVVEWFTVQCVCGKRERLSVQIHWPTPCAHPSEPGPYCRQCGQKVGA